MIGDTCPSSDVNLTSNDALTISTAECASVFPGGCYKYLCWCKRLAKKHLHLIKHSLQL